MTEHYPVSNRIQSLAQPKRVYAHKDRSPYTLVSLPVLKFQTSNRLLSLSLPKIRKDYHVKTEFSRNEYDPTNSCVFNEAALRTQCTPYVATLARPKSDYKGYQFAYPVQREISHSARNATASERITKLSTPRIKKDYHVKE